LKSLHLHLYVIRDTQIPIELITHQHQHYLTAPESAVSSAAERLRSPAGSSANLKIIIGSLGLKGSLRRNMNHARRAIKRTPAPIPIPAAAFGLSVDELVVEARLELGVEAGLVELEEEDGVVELVVETVDGIEVVEGVAVYHVLVLAG
jgi:hypothetical protein